MDYSTMLIALMAVPVLAAILIAVLPSKSGSHAMFAGVHLISLTAVLVLSVMLILHVVFTIGDSVQALGLWFRLDALGAVFVGLIAVVGFITGAYSLAYIKHDLEIGHMNMSQVKQYYAFFNLFVFSMLLVALSNNIIMMWVSVEATTLATVFLVGSYNTKLSLEAAWKYVIVCTAGVAFGLYSTVLIYANAADIMPDPHLAVFWTELLPYANQFDPMLVQIAFVFAAIGFGTKAGLFPMHTWLPDAHAEAPSPVSALLSGVLLKCAILIIIRFYIVATECSGPEFPQLVMMILGIVSVAFSAFAIFAQHDIKRKLAYHSVENIGIVALCLGFGGPLGIVAALLHSIFHAFTKALMFCLSGNLLMKYGTRDMNKITGILKVAPVTGVLLIMGVFALAGFPPFAMFISEVVGIVAGIVSGNIAVVIIFVLALTVVIASLTKMSQKSVMGVPPEGMKKGDVNFWALAPEVLLVGILLWFGVALPTPVLYGVEEATSIVMQEDSGVLHDEPLFSELFGAIENE